MSDHAIHKSKNVNIILANEDFAAICLFQNLYQSNIVRHVSFSVRILVHLDKRV